MTNKKRLKKKGWTGEEVGKLLIASMLNDIKQQEQQKKTSLFSQSDFDQMVSSLKSDRDHLTYGVYKTLYSSIIDGVNSLGGLRQQFYNGYFCLVTQFNEVWNADSAQRSLDNTPIIMTESQYKRLKAKAAKTISEYKANFCFLVFSCLASFLKAEETYTKEEAPAVWEALETAKKIPATGNRFLPIYNETCKNGYYCLPDGRRSDQMTSEEWEKTLKEELENKKNTNKKLEAISEKLQRCIASCELFFAGDAAIKEPVLKQTEKQLINSMNEKIKKSFNIIINNTGEDSFNPDAKEIAKFLDRLVNSTAFIEWHAYEEPPKNLNLYDLLNVYSRKFFLGDSEADRKEILKHFKKDVPALYDAIKVYIESKVPHARGLKTNQLHKDIISFGELATAGFINYSKLLQIDDKKIIDIAIENEDITENRGKQGIAVLKHPAPHQIDEQGDYIEQKNPYFLLHTLYFLEANEDKVAEIHDYVNKFMYPALGYLYAFNALMEIIGKVYDLPELAKVAKCDTAPLEKEMSCFNVLLYVFYRDVYGNESEKRHKRAIIKKAFKPLEADTLKPSQKAIEKITSELTKLGFSNDAKIKLRYLDPFIGCLMNSREGDL